MRRSLISAGALVAAVAGSLVLAPAASATDSPVTLPLHQPTPITAADFGKGGDCPTIPSDKDGWHFIIPGKGVVFTKLTVTFDNGAPVVITDFGPPKDDHAYVASEPGAKLTSAVAEVSGEVEQGWFNLSHTCPADVKPSPSDTPSGTPSTSESPSTSASPSATESGAAGGQPTPSSTSSAGAEGDLAETGSSAPVGIIAGVAVALAAAGAFLVTRRRKAQQH